MKAAAKSPSPGQLDLFGVERAKTLPRPALQPRGGLELAAGGLRHGDKGGPFWTVEIAGDGVVIVHHSGMRVPIWSSGLEHCRDYVRRSVPELEANAFDELVGRYRAP